MLVSGSASSFISSLISGAGVPAGSDAGPAITSASGTGPSTGTTSGIAVPSTCALVKHKPHDISTGGYEYYTGQTTPSWPTYLLLQWPLAA
jgi:hypothetical protein